MPERVPFAQKVEIGPGDKVENWLKSIEETMISSLRDLALQSYAAFPSEVAKRYEWIFGPYPA